MRIAEHRLQRLLIKRLTKLGASLRYDLQASAAQAATLGMNLAVTTLGRAKELPGAVGPSMDEMVAYLDRVERGFDDGPAPGGGRLLPFWPNDTALTSDDGTGGNRTIYTQIMPVQELREVVARLRVETLIDGAGTTVLTVAPQWSIDGNWWEDPTLTFTQVDAMTEKPFEEAIRFDNFGAYMRFAIKFVEPSGMGGVMGAKMDIMGVGR